MKFAGSKTYISKKKIESVKDKKLHLKSDLKQELNVVKEEVASEEEKEVEKDFSKILSDKLRKSRNSAINSSLNRNRSLSNSIKKIKDEELDFAYSDDEPEEVFVVDKFSKKKGKPNTLCKLGSKIKGISSKNKATKIKKVLYNVSPLIANNEMMSNNIQKTTYEHQVDTNVISLKFEFLKDKVAFAIGDPVKCQCEAILNVTSKIEPVDGSDKMLWICEFCSEKNEIYLEKEEIPTSDCIDYFIQSVNQVNKGQNEYHYNDVQSLIFCFDISGSMCVSSPISGKHVFKGNTLEKTKKELMAFSNGSNQFYGKSNKNITYISRLQCLQAAIESNLQNMLKATPNRKVGFVTFNNEVIGYGDGTKEQVKINGNNLCDLEYVETFGKMNQNIITTPLKESHNYLLKQLYSIEESGQTALGPAVLFSINLIGDSAAGSRIILCTDGISNMGLGSMDSIINEKEIEDLKNFYANMGAAAKEKGIIIDLITFEEEQSNIDILVSMIEQTGGDIIRVKPTEILEGFSNLLTNEVVATNVKIKIKLHKLMNFRNEEANELKNEGCTLVKEVGNATKETELFIEYGFKNSDEIAIYEDIDLDKLISVPFQSIIEYTNKNGDKCLRVQTLAQQICSDKEDIQNDAQYDILSTNAIQKSSKLAKQGNYRAAQSNALAWKKMIKSNAEKNINAYNNYKVFNNNMMDFNNNIQELQYKELCFGMNSNNLVKQEVASKKKIQSDKISQQIHSLNKISQVKSISSYQKNKK